MAVSRSEIQVQWSTANSISVSAGAGQTSDEFNLAADAYEAQITCKADNAGSPASGDTIDLYLLRTSGDPDGAATDEFDTVGGGLYLGQLDTNDEDPKIRTFDIPTASKGAKLRAVSNASTNSITVSAAVYQVKSGA